MWFAATEGHRVPGSEVVRGGAENDLELPFKDIDKFDFGVERVQLVTTRTFRFDDRVQDLDVGLGGGAKDVAVKGPAQLVDGRLAPPTRVVTKRGALWERGDERERERERGRGEKEGEPIDQKGVVSF